MREEKHHAAASPVITAVLLVLLLPILYVASTGPALWLKRNGFMTDSTLDTIYCPLIWAAERTELKTHLRQYALLWVKD